MESLISNTGVTELPSETLMHRVSGSRNAAEFLCNGQNIMNDLTRALSKINKSFSDFDHVLDFGCGCGRSLIWCKEIAKKSNIYGSDFDAEAIAWCREHIPFGKYYVNQALPLTKFPTGMFDLIFAVSVFTHLNLDYQLSWLSELKRISAPGGYLLLTCHGETVWRNLPPERIETLRKDGVLFDREPFWENIFPDWYRSTYHTLEYLNKVWTEFFDIIDYIPQGMNGHQDIVVLRNK